MSGCDGRHEAQFPDRRGCVGDACATEGAREQETDGLSERKRERNQGQEVARIDDKASEEAAKMEVGIKMNVFKLNGSKKGVGVSSESVGGRREAVIRLTGRGRRQKEQREERK